MSERKTLVNQDYLFAAVLDANCRMCRVNGNFDQLIFLKSRGLSHPDELNVVNGLKKHCEGCLQNNRPLGDTISDRLSCLWRSPYIVQEE